MQVAGVSVFDRIGKFAEDSMRNDALAFVGRETELAAAQRRVADCVDSDPKSNVFVMLGAPGMGKTASASQLVRLMHGETLRGRLIVCMHLSASALSAPPLNFVSGLRRRMVRMADGVRNGLHTRLRGGVSKMAGMGFDITKKWTEHGHVLRTSGLTEKSSAMDCIDAFADGMLMSDKVVLALMFDEAQDMEITPTTKDNVSTLYQNLHGGRIVPMFFGLPNTLQVLSQVGISRLESRGRVFELGCFAGGEPTQLVDKGLAKLGVKWNNAGWGGFMRKCGFAEGAAKLWRKRLVKRIVSASSGFPRHLSAGLTAFCETILNRKDEFSPKNDLLAEIGERHEALRIAYYDERLKAPVAQAHLSALGAMAHMMGDGGGLMRKDAAQLLDMGSEWTDRRDADESLDALIGRGVLTTGGAGGVFIGPPAIPSMTAHLRGVFHDLLSQGHDGAQAMAKAHGDPPRHGNIKTSSTEPPKREQKREDEKC